MVKYKIGTRVGVPLGKQGKRIAYGKILQKRKDIFRGRKIIVYLIKFDDGDTGWYHSPEFRKVKKRG